MSDNRELSCAQRIDEHLRGRLEDLELLQWAARLEHQAGNDFACLTWEPDFEEAPTEDLAVCENCGRDLGEHWEVLAKAEEFEGTFGPELLDDEANVNEDAVYTARDEYPLGIDSNIQMRIQLSTGGPGDEFLVTVDPEDGEITEIRYRFLDWFDGATVTLQGTDHKTAEAFCSSFVEIEMMQFNERKGGFP